MPKIILESSDHVKFTVDVRVAKVFMTITDMLDQLGFNQEEGHEEVIPVTVVEGDILKRVIEWAEKHKYDPPVVEDNTSGKRTVDIDEWDQEFLKVEQPILFKLIMAANFLDIKGLLDITCKTVANMIKGKTPDQIRQMFNIKNDFTPEEEKQIQKENEWCQL